MAKSKNDQWLAYRLLMFLSHRLYLLDLIKVETLGAFHVAVMRSHKSGKLTNKYPDREI